MHQKYEKPDSHGYVTVPVLQYLNGKPWDDMAMNYVHSLRPSYIRVSDGAIDADSRPWRVTVFLKDDKINWIEQEVEVGLKGCRDGSDFGIHKEPVMVEVDKDLLKKMKDTLIRIENETRTRVIEAYTFDPNFLRGSILCLDNPRVRGVDVIIRFKLNDKEYEFREFIDHADHHAGHDHWAFKEFTSKIRDGIFNQLMEVCGKAMNRRGKRSTLSQ